MIIQLNIDIALVKANIEKEPAAKYEWCVQYDSNFLVKGYAPNVRVAIEKVLADLDGMGVRID
jgi:hypothetical protein